MIQETGTIFSVVVFVCFGLFAGLVCCVFSLFSKVMKNTFIVTFVCDAFAPLCSCLLFLVALFKFESGAVSFFSVISFLIGLLFVLFFVQNLFVNGALKVYNKLKSKKKS